VRSIWRGIAISCLTALVTVASFGVGLADSPVTVAGNVVLVSQPWPQQVTVTLSDPSGNVLAEETLPAVTSSSGNGQASVPFELTPSTPPAPGTYNLGVEITNLVPNVTASGVDNTNPSQSTFTYPVTIGTTPVSGLEVNLFLDPVEVQVSRSTVAPGQADEVTVRFARPFLAFEPYTMVVQSTPGATLTPESADLSPLTEFSGLSANVIEMKPVEVTPEGTPAQALIATATTPLSFRVGDALGINLSSADEVMKFTFQADTPGTYPIYVTDPGGNVVLGEATVDVSTSPAPPPPTFQDLGSYGWAAGAIDALAAQGVVNGVAPGRFDPGSPVTRSQFAALVNRILKLPAPLVPVGYQDVPNGSWAYGAVEAMSPFMPGASATTFSPDAAIDRQDVATVLVKVLADEGLVQVLSDSESASVLGPVKDASLINPADRDYVATAIQSRIMLGNPDGTFDPTGLLSRAEIAVLLQRLEGSFGMGP
jgi:hypothetical protein